MDRIPEFVANHPLLFAALAAVIAMIVVLEVQRARRVARPVSPAQATRMNNNSDAAFIDVRPKKSFDEAHLPGARSVPIAEVDGCIKQLRKLRDRPVILYDDGALDAERAAKALHRHGFEQLYALDGGLPAWRKAELPIRSGGSGRKAQAGGKSRKKGGRSDERPQKAGQGKA